jgi:hypothetical protein
MLRLQHFLKSEGKKKKKFQEKDFSENNKLDERKKWITPIRMWETEWTSLKLL